VSGRIVFFSFFCCIEMRGLCVHGVKRSARKRGGGRLSDKQAEDREGFKNKSSDFGVSGTGEKGREKEQVGGDK
jgi:hypothetical protein